jgi:hypothetical protein
MGLKKVEMEAKAQLHSLHPELHASLDGSPPCLDGNEHWPSRIQFSLLE